MDDSLYLAILIFSESHWEKILHTFPEYISSSTDIFIEFFANQSIAKSFQSSYHTDFRELLPKNIDLLRTHIN